jgi:hypothetical protein
MLQAMPSACSRLHAWMPSQVLAILMYTRLGSTPLAAYSSSRRRALS